MYNEILGKMIIKVYYMKYRENYMQEGFAKALIVENDIGIHPVDEDLNIYILPTDYKFEKEKYYKCEYKENTNKLYNKETPYVAINMQPVNGIEITEDFEEYIINKKICWNDLQFKIVYAPYERTEQYKYIEGWNKEIWMKYTYEENNTNYLFELPSVQTTEIKDLMDDKEKLSWIKEDLKKYKRNTQEILNQFIEENKLIGNTDILYNKRWEKAISLLQTVNYNYEMINKLQNNEIIKTRLEEYAKQYLSKKYEEEVKKSYEELEKIEVQIEEANAIIINAQQKIERIKEEKNQYKKDIILIKEEKEKLIEEKKDLKIKIEQEKVEYSLLKKDKLISFIIDSIKNGKFYENNNAMIIKKYKNISDVIDQINDIKHDKLIIYPNSKWISFDDLWSSGFGAIFEMAHENKEQLYVVIIQNYNLSPCELWSMPLVNLIYEYTNKLPYTQNIGYPKNLWIYFIESELEEISFPVSEYFNGIFND